MDEQLERIVRKMVAELKPWLDQPGEAGRKVAQVREQLNGLKAELGAGVIGDTLKTLEKAEAEAKRSRQREAAEAIAAQCKALGVVLTPGEPPKRQRRKAAPRAKKKERAETPAGNAGKA